MGLRAVVAHHLPDLPDLELLDHPRADEQRQQQRRHHREDGAQRQVREDVECREMRSELFRQPVKHQCAPCESELPTSASTTRSSRLLRDPLTSTHTSRVSSPLTARASVSLSANHSPPAPKASTASAASLPVANSRSTP